MVWDRQDQGWRLLVLALALWLVAFVPSGAAAYPVAALETCHANVEAGKGYAAIAHKRAWVCNPEDWSIDGETLYLRYRLNDAESAALPRGFVTFASRYSAITFTVVDADGRMRQSRHGRDEALHSPAGPLMVLALPEVTRASRLLVVRIDGPWTIAIGSNARLDHSPGGTGWPIGQIVAMAVICGLMIVPLLLNGAFYSVLPERFVLWHLVLVGSMLLQVSIGTGFIHLIAHVPEYVEGPLSNACYATIGAAALMFAATYFEPGKLSRRLRRLLRRTAFCVFAVGLISALPFAFMRPYATKLIHFDMIPAMVLLAVAAFDARRRGSAAAVYQMVAWAPALMAGMWKVGCYVLPFARASDTTVLYHLCLAFQAYVTTLGIIARFVDLRHQRDSANARARELEGVAGRDPLTGLRNRRAIERRFAELLDDGFRTMAVLDLDHFKVVNDTRGHAVGDRVLQVVATVLAEDTESRAIRMGGEEFMLLMRGRDAAERAERCRRAISARVAAEVPGLDGLLTASMGLVEHDRDGHLHVEFDALYAHCDRLLYEAKRLGRNRTMRERITGFGGGEVGARAVS